MRELENLSRGRSAVGDRSDILEMITVFSARLYGYRSSRNKELLKSLVESRAYTVNEFVISAIVFIA
jgi:hypothetical protein